MQRRIVVLVTVVLGVLVVVEDELHNLHVPPLRRHVEGGLLILVFIVTLGTRLDQ